MSEGYINLFKNDDTSGNRPHYKLTFKLDGVWHEAALWPAKDGKKGFSGKFKPQEKREYKQPEQKNEVMAHANYDDDSSIPF